MPKLIVWNLPILSVVIAFLLAISQRVWNVQIKMILASMIIEAQSFYNIITSTVFQMAKIYFSLNAAFIRLVNSKILVLCSSLFQYLSYEVVVTRSVFLIYSVIYLFIYHMCSCTTSSSPWFSVNTSVW